MAIEIQDSWLPVSETDVSAFEGYVGMPLPKEYAKFLCITNGGSSPDQIRWDQAIVFQFYGLNTDVRYADLGWQAINMVTTATRLRHKCNKCFGPDSFV